MEKFNFSDYEKQIANKSVTTIDAHASIGGGKYSVTIVCSKKNGKRVSLSASLASRLKIDDALYVTAYKDAGVVIIGATAYNQDSTRVTVTGDDRKNAYNTVLVHFLIDTFELDFSNCISRSYGDIVFNDDSRNPMGVLCFDRSKATAPVAEVSQDANNEDACLD
jgi:hypothetical protein